MKIGVTGGKGGTGKTVIALNLAIALAKNNSVTLVDCDVDCPNTHILAGATLKAQKPVTSFIPDIDPKKCDACGECVKACRVNTLYLVKGKVYLDEKICTGCEACRIVCPNGAISAKEKTVGHTYEFNAHGVRFVVGSLVPSEPISAMLVKAAKERAFKKSSDFYIIDTAAGIHCDVVDALRGCDRAFAVTEPTPFGVHDLNLIEEVLKTVSLSYEIIVNRSDITKQKVKDAALEIPYDMKMMECYVEGTPIVLKYPDHPISKKFFELAKRVKNDI